MLIFYNVNEVQEGVERVVTKYKYRCDECGKEQPLSENTMKDCIVCGLTFCEKHTMTEFLLKQEDFEDNFHYCNSCEKYVNEYNKIELPILDIIETKQKEIDEHWLKIRQLQKDLLFSYQK